jgi:hypothetical protein
LSEVAVILEGVAETAPPLNVTLVAVARFVPVTVNVVPAAAHVGATVVTVGGGVTV